MNLRRSGAAVIVAVGLGASWAAPATPSPRQQVYDAAQAAYDHSDWSAAATGFATLLPTKPEASLSHADAVIAGRYADTLAHLERRAEAQSWASRAVMALAHDPDPTFLGEALMVKGDLARKDYDYATAFAAYEGANTALGPNIFDAGVLKARLGLASVGATLEPARVTAMLTPLVSSPDFARRLDRMSRADIEDLAAQAALNENQKKAAQKLIGRAVDDSGGLGTHVSVLQSYVRSDAGLIARLNQDDDKVRLYFSYSGAGHMEDMDWVGAHTGDLPVCDGPGGGVRPNDSVVVRLRIAEDGHVEDAIPVYASRIGSLGETFARAASTWRWDPDRLKKVSPFWRDTLQLELRCVTRPRPQEFDTQSRREAAAWLSQRTLDHAARIDPAGSGADVIRHTDTVRLRAEDDMTLDALLETATGPDLMQMQWSRLDTLHAPPAVYAVMIERFAGKRSLFGHTFSGGARPAAEDYEKWVAKFEQQFPDDPAIYWLRLQEIFAWELAHDFHAATILLERLISTPTSRLAANDPVREVALLHHAIVLQRAGKEQEAHDSLAKSGLTSDQCELFDTHPLPRNTNISNSAFPAEALKWNFEGYVKEAYDIADDGSVANVRTVVAYPPYIFEPTTESAVKEFKYYPPRLGGRAVGCDGQQLSVQYQIGH